MTQSLRLASDVMVPMRDGVRLATDIYSPATSAGPWPAILVRNSYNKTFSEWDGGPGWYVQRGYVFIIQDIRSRYKSEGDGRYYHTCNNWEDVRESRVGIMTERRDQARDLHGYDYHRRQLHCIAPEGVGAKLRAHKHLMT